MAPLPNIETYPKTIRLRDGASVSLRPLEAKDKVRLLRFFQRVPEEERYYLKENVTSPEVIHAWTTSMDLERVMPIVAVAGEEIVADATLHRSRAPARRHIGELRVVVDPSYRKAGLGRRLLRELLDIAADLGLHQATFELVLDREDSAILMATGMGFQQIAILKERIRDFWGNYQDLVLLEIPLGDRKLWWSP